MKNYVQLHELINAFDSKERKAYINAVKQLKSYREEHLLVVEAIGKSRAVPFVELIKKFKLVIGSNPSQFFGEQYELALRSVALRQGSLPNVFTEYEIKIELLTQKGLFRHVERQLVKAIHQADSEEQFSRGLLFIDILSDLISTKMVHLANLPASCNYKRFATEFADKESNLRSYKSVFSLLSEAYSVGVTECVEVANAISRMEEFSEESHCKSIRARIFFHRLRFFVSFFTKEYNTALRHSSDIVKILDDFPTLKSDGGTYSVYLQMIANKGILNGVLGRFQKSRECLKTLRILSNPQFAHADEAFLRYASLRVNCAIQNGDSEPREVIDLFEARLGSSLFDLKSETKVEICYQLGVWCLMTGNPNLALSIFHHFWNAGVWVSRKDLHLVARLLFLLAHLELGNHEFVENELPKLKRSMKKESHGKDVAAFCIPILTQLAREGLSSIVFKKCHQKLAIELDTQQWTMASNYFDIELWLSAKLNHTTMNREHKKRTQS